VTQEIEELIKKFKEIKKQGYVKSVVKSKNGAGITLEHLVGSSGDDFPIPDFKGIELKAIRNYKFAEFDLFNASPDGKYVYPSQWIAQNFGYPDRDYKDIKVFKGNIDAKNLNRIGLFYYFKLKVDRLNQKIILEVYNSKKILINNDIYWDFDTLKSKLELKLKKLAVIDVQKLYSLNEYYYYYENMNIYSLKSFDVFIDLIDKGIIFVTFKTGVTKSGKYQGKFQDHGTAFRISKNNLEKLFNKIY
jgi:hypothetical protein